MIPLRLALIAAVLCSAPAAAQPHEDDVPIVRVSKVLAVPQGTRIPLRTLETLSSKKARQGQRVPLEVASDVVFDGIVIVPKGTRAAGEISRVTAKGVLGKSGKLGLRVMFLELGGQRVRLDGEARDKGSSGAAPVVLASVLIGVSGVFVTGTSAVIPAGTAVDGFLHDDLKLGVLLP
jgi:hypothetical protein